MAGILLNRSRQVPAEETPAFGGIAERFRRAGDLDRAIALCRDGLKRFPDQLSARVTLGWSFLDKGQYEEARAELERVLRKAPDNLAAIRGLAELHDRSEGAMSALDEKQWQQHQADEQSADAAAALAASRTPSPAHATASSSSLAPPELSAAVGPVAGSSGTLDAVAPTQAADPFAPIAVSLSFDSRATPELLRTADHAGLAAEAAAAGQDFFEPHVDEAPVELEDPAAASMAAAAAPGNLVDTSSIQRSDAVVGGPVPEDVAAAAAEIEAEIARLAELPSFTVDGEGDSLAAAFSTVVEAPEFELAANGESEVEPFSLTIDETVTPVAGDAFSAEQVEPGVTLDVSFGPTESDTELDQAIRDLEAGADLQFGVAESGATDEVPTFAPTAVSFESIDASQADAGPFEEVDVVLGAGASDADPAGPLFELVAPEPQDVAAFATAGLDPTEELSEATDEFSGDLIALAEIEPEPVAEAEAVPDPVFEAPAAAFPAEPARIDEPIAAMAEVADMELVAAESHEPASAIHESAAALLADADAFDQSSIANAPPALGVVLGLPVRRTDHARMAIARLERFLRQVETRQLQLRTETVA